jgi:hypothetical protein
MPAMHRWLVKQLGHHAWDIRKMLERGLSQCSDQSDANADA